jgi:dUTP pyrophosphatase
MYDYDDVLEKYSRKDSKNLFTMRFEKVSLETWITAAKKQDNSRTENFFHLIEKYNEDELHSIWENIKLPQRATKFSAGYDFFAPVSLKIDPGEIITIPTGIKWKPARRYDSGNHSVDIPFFLSIYPRSSLGRDYSLREPNIVSIIDADYYGNISNEGHIMINIKNEGTNGSCKIEAGRAYAQGIIQRYYVTDDDDVTATRTGGFGSTNK